jgi:hypothetical protein
LIKLGHYLGVNLSALVNDFTASIWSVSAYNKGLSIHHLPKPELIMASKALRSVKKIRIKCAFQSMSGNMYNGTTRSLSLSSAFIECQPLAGALKTRPKISDMGNIKLFVTIDGNQVSINSRCRIVNVFPDGLDVEAQFAYIGKNELVHFESIMRS